MKSVDAACLTDGNSFSSQMPTKLHKDTSTHSFLECLTGRELLHRDRGRSRRPGVLHVREKSSWFGAATAAPGALVRFVTHPQNVRGSNPCWSFSGSRSGLKA